MKTNRWFAIVAAAGVSLIPLMARAEEPKWPGIITSVSSSATISTKGMSPGGEVWANWLSLPPGKAVEEPAAPPNLGKWAVIAMALSGSAVEIYSPAIEGADPPGMCSALLAGGRQVPNSEASEARPSPGDMFACNSAHLPPDPYAMRTADLSCMFAPNWLSAGPGFQEWSTPLRFTAKQMAVARSSELARPNLARWKGKSSARAL